MPTPIAVHQSVEQRVPFSITSSDILTVSEAAAVLKISPDTVRSMCDRGELPFRKCGNRRRFPGWLLIEWLHDSQLKKGGD
ncbi:helix-turn-helix domain-containing protein [uncultured Cloacibacillus sp.]|uniref:helix-turn-helix domain-containing protein n=1 Tax=uncultured Cloacibacillus sp. TaxID=889794 RepID=UPI0027D9372C|nr:helix-turn-helix domain-containing protein [uncultured Cloacibacillus sp.]